MGINKLKNNQYLRNKLLDVIKERYLVMEPWGSMRLNLKKGDKVTFLHWDGGFQKGIVVSGGNSYNEWQFYDIKCGNTIYGTGFNLNSKLTGIKLNDGSIYLSSKHWMRY